MTSWSSANPLQQRCASRASWSQTSSRISEIEITGRNRTNRNNKAKNKPIVPRERGPVPERGEIHAPGRRQEIAMQAGDDDHEPLEPHADIDDERDDEQHRHVACAADLNQKNCGARRCTRSDIQ